MAGMAHVEHVDASSATIADAKRAVTIKVEVHDLASRIDAVAALAAQLEPIIALLRASGEAAAVDMAALLTYEPDGASVEHRNQDDLLRQRTRYMPKGVARSTSHGVSEEEAGTTKKGARAGGAQASPPPTSPPPAEERLSGAMDLLRQKTRCMEPGPRSRPAERLAGSLPSSCLLCVPLSQGRTIGSHRRRQAKRRRRRGGCGGHRSGRRGGARAPARRVAELR